MSSGDQDFAALKLDADGTIEWKWQVCYIYNVISERNKTRKYFRCDAAAFWAGHAMVTSEILRLAGDRE